MYYPNITMSITSTGQVHIMNICDDDLIPMFWTNLRDKNGKEIYESDLVKINNFGALKEIFMRSGCWFVEGSKELGYFHSYKIEIISNIYEKEKQWTLYEKKKSGFGLSLKGY